MIICFTGTGNSLYVARKLSERLGDEVTVLEKELLTSPGTAQLSVADGRIIWVFPTYSWGVPPVVVNFIRASHIGLADTCDHFMVTTCGDDTGNCHKMWRKEIRRRGWKARSAFSVTMPNTYVNMRGFDVDSPETEQKKIDCSTERIDEISRQIHDNSDRDDVVRGSWPTVKTSVIYPWFKRFEMSPEKFTVDTSLCTSCSLCSQRCPTGNIEMVNRHPKWNDNCAMCLRCYHICPVHAVGYANATGDKGQYRRFLKKTGSQG